VEGHCECDNALSCLWEPPTKRQESSGGRVTGQPSIDTTMEDWLPRNQSSIVASPRHWMKTTVKIYM
jgi:hypothetical protein